MLFNSHEFILLFMPIVCGVYFLLGQSGRIRPALAWIAAASLAFYSYWDARYLALLLASIVWNYALGKKIEATRSKNWLFLAVAVNLGLLAYYKYTAFFLSTWNEFSGAALFVPQIVLPLGISFFTFTQIAFLVDAYRGETKGYTFLTYLVFVTYFPHLIAGPILYHKDVIPQFFKRENYAFQADNFALGLLTFVLGLAKKVLIADNLAPWAQAVFAAPAAAGFFEAWSGAIAYTLQLFFDFSGYSEMAIGLGLMLNIHLPVNFNSPYKATSIIDFWRRWHMTLSAFLKNYLYIPLGGNRAGEGRRYVNLLATMLLGGLWHGAAWTFVIWGGLHGVYLCVNHMWRKTNWALPPFIAWALTFVCVVIAWVFFRAETTADALRLLQTMLLPGQAVLALSAKTKNQLLILALALAFAKLAPDSMDFGRRFAPNWGWTMAITALFLWCLTAMNKVSEFLYFQF